MNQKQNKKQEYQTKVLKTIPDFMEREVVRLVMQIQLLVFYKKYFLTAQLVTSLYNLGRTPTGDPHQ